MLLTCIWFSHFDCIQFVSVFLFNIYWRTIHISLYPIFKSLNGVLILKPFPVLIEIKIIPHFLSYEIQGIWIYVDIFYSSELCAGYITTWILLHTTIQFDQDHLLKMLSFFFLWVFLSSLSKIRVCIGVSIYVWVFNSIPTNNMSVFVPIACCF